MTCLTCSSDASRLNMILRGSTSAAGWRIATRLKANLRVSAKDRLCSLTIFDPILAMTVASRSRFSDSAPDSHFARPCNQGLLDIVIRFPQRLSFRCYPPSVQGHCRRHELGPHRLLQLLLPKKISNARHVIAKLDRCSSTSRSHLFECCHIIPHLHLIDVDPLFSGSYVSRTLQQKPASPRRQPNALQTLHTQDKCK